MQVLFTFSSVDNFIMLGNLLHIPNITVPASSKMYLNAMKIRYKEIFQKSPIRSIRFHLVFVMRFVVVTIFLKFRLPTTLTIRICNLTL